MDRRTRILSALGFDDERGQPSARLCEGARDVLGVSGAGIMLMSGDLPQGSLCTTNAVSNLIEELQYTLGEGPSVDACRQGQVVVEADLAAPVVPRWLAFTPRAVEAGVRGIFAFPLLEGAVRLGALNLYRGRPGHLGADQHADGLVVAEVIARWVLDAQAGAPAGAVARDLQTGSDFHLVVQHAAGMTSVQLGVSVTEAHIRLRAYAFGANRPLRDVAEDVVARRLRLS